MSEIIAKKDEPKRTDRYWICPACARSKMWSAPEWPVTVVLGVCGWCDCAEVQTLTPTVDYSGPGKRAVWD